MMFTILSISRFRHIRLYGLAFLTFLFLMISTIVFWQYFKTSTPTPVEVPQTNVEKNTVEYLTPEREQTIQKQVASLVQEGDISACEKVENDLYRKICINNIALNKANETRDISHCQYIDGDLIHNNLCEQGVLLTKSIDEQDISVCAETKNLELKEQCESAYHISLALKKNDPTICNQNSDQLEADSCWNSYHAQIFSSEGADCSVFRGDEAQTDCAVLTMSQENINFETMQAACSKLKTSLFTQLCTMFGI